MQIGTTDRGTGQVKFGTMPTPTLSQPYPTEQFNLDQIWKTKNQTIQFYENINQSAME